MAASTALRRFKTDAFLSLNNVVLLDCNLFEINISYGFGNITMPTAFGTVDCNLKLVV